MECVTPPHCRCLAGDSTHTITASQYHSALGVEVPAWGLNTTWRAPPARWDHVPVSIWTLFQVRPLCVNGGCHLKPLGFPNSHVRDARLMPVEVP